MSDDSEIVIKKDDWVAVSYTGKLQTGEIFDTSEGKEPLGFQVGAGMVIKGFDDNVVGMKIGEEKEFTIQAKEAYGEVTNDQTQDVPKEVFKEVPDLALGLFLLIETPYGPMKAEILGIADDTVKIGLNHPLAGEDLSFSIKLEKRLSDDEVEAIKKQMEAATQETCDSNPDGGCGGCSGCG